MKYLFIKINLKEFFIRVYLLVAWKIKFNNYTYYMIFYNLKYHKISKCYWNENLRILIIIRFSRHCHSWANVRAYAGYELQPDAYECFVSDRRVGCNCTLDAGQSIVWRRGWKPLIRVSAFGRHSARHMADCLAQDVESCSAAKVTFFPFWPIFTKLYVRSPMRFRCVFFCRCVSEE